MSIPGALQPSAWVSLATFVLLCMPTTAAALERTFSTDADFDEGTLVGVNHETSDQLQLDVRVSEHPFLWVPKSGRRSIVRIDANTGEIVGEYLTAPDGRSGSPSRTAVDRFGNVWVGNQSGQGSVAKIGLVVGGTRGRKESDGSFVADPTGSYLAPPFFYSTAIDRDGDGLIRTSHGLGDVLAWPDVTDGEGGVTAVVEDAEDECILLFQRTSATKALHVSVDPQGHAWVGGYAATPMHFDKLDAETGQIMETMLPTCGGYGGVVDAQGVVWSASFSSHRLMRYDPASGASSCVPVVQSTGVAVDNEGYIWNTTWDRNGVAKITPDGTMLPGFPKLTGGRNSFGIAVTPADGNVWVANKRTNDVSRLDADGTVRKRIAVGAGPMGVAVDTNGKVWVVNQFDENVARINPDAGADGLGDVDLTVALGAGARPVTYGHMAGMITTRELTASGTWTVAIDGGDPTLDWGKVTWQSDEPGASGIAVHTRTADEAAGLPLASWNERSNGDDFSGTGVIGRWTEVRATFTADLAAGVSPLVHELVISASANAGEPFECSDADPSVEEIWPPNGRMVAVDVLGVVDALGEPARCTITAIQQDEPLDNGNADAWGIGTSTAYVRAKRAGMGDGRVYTISYRADDGNGGQCTGTVRVCVPHDMGSQRSCEEGAPLFDSTAGRTIDKPLADHFPNPFNPSTTIRYTLPAAARVQLTIYNVLGRRVRTLASGPHAAGQYTVPWDGRDEVGRAVASGVYVYRLRTETAVISKRMLLLK